MSPDPSPGQPPTYAERLWMPWWWWVIAALVVALLGAELHIGLGWVAATVTYVVFGVLAAGFLLRWALRIRVGGDLTAGRHTVPLSRITEVRVLERADTRDVLSSRPETSAVVLLRGYVRQVVYVGTDGSDGAPAYLLLSSRHPVELAAALVGGPEAAD